MIIFPPLEQANPDGLLAVSEEIDVDYLISAYTSGIFPWPYEETLIPWVSPPERAVIFFAEFKVPDSVKREQKKAKFHVRVNTNFEKVINSCAKTKRKHEPGTWITKKIIDAYTDLHKAGYAICFETYDQDENLVGGLYGVLINKYFSGESMFYKTSGASKFALIKAVEYFQSREMSWIDIQVMSPLFRNFGGKTIPRTEFIKIMRKAIEEPLRK